MLTQTYLDYVIPDNYCNQLKACKDSCGLIMTSATLGILNSTADSLERATTS